MGCEAARTNEDTCLIVGNLGVRLNIRPPHATPPPGRVSHVN